MTSTWSVMLNQGVIVGIHVSFLISKGKFSIFHQYIYYGYFLSITSIKLRRFISTSNSSSCFSALRGIYVGVVWCSVVWCDVVQCGIQFDVAQHSAVWYDVVWYSVEGCGVVLCDVVGCGAMWYNGCCVGWHGVTWCNAVQCGVTQCGVGGVVYYSEV